MTKKFSQNKKPEKNLNAIYSGYLVYLHKFDIMYEQYYNI